ncbi:MAG: mechanosensitive ion channel family protein [Thermoanaerobaculia bacterium]
MQGWLDYRIYGNPAADLLLGAGITILVLAIIWAIRTFLKRRLADSEQTETYLDDFVNDLVLRTKLLLVFFVVLNLSTNHLMLEPPIHTALRALAVLAGLIQLGFWGVGIIDFAITRHRRRRFETDPAAVTTLSAFGFFGKIAIWAVVALAALENFGLQVGPLIAGLGIGGIAIALAAQNILGDLFASLSIVLDKPFVLGDFIIVGEQLGTVEHIGLKTTRVRALSGEQLIFSNSDLLGSRIRNFKRMIERRVLFRFGVLYSSTREQLEQVPGIVREVVETQQNARFDRAHFQKFGDSSLDFEVVYWMLVPDYNVYMDVQQQVNFELFTRLQAIGLSFAFPTRTLHIDTWPDAAVAGRTELG